MNFNKSSFYSSILLLFLSLGVSLAQVSHAQGLDTSGIKLSADEQLKVVFHINERAKLGYLKSSVVNIKKALGDKVTVAVVFNGSAVTRLLKNSLSAQDIKLMIDKGAEVGACSNALIANNIKREQLAEGVEFILEGGVVRLTTMQKNGYAYIKI